MAGGVARPGLLALVCALLGLLLLQVGRRGASTETSLQQALSTLRREHETKSDALRLEVSKLKEWVTQVAGEGKMRALLKQENAALKARIDRLEADLLAQREMHLLIDSGSVSRAAPARLPATAAATAAVAPRAEGSIEFSRERLLSIAPSRQVLLTFVNKIRLDFAVTWVSHVRRLKLNNFLVGAADAEALRGLQGLRIPTFDMKTDLGTSEWPWGSKSFKLLGPHKIEMIYQSLVWGFDVLITDIDALVLRDPFPYMARFPQADFLTTSDHLGNTTADDGLETHGAIHTAFNIGYMFFRNGSLPLVSEWRKRILEDPSERWDQGEFNSLARRHWRWQDTQGLSSPRLFHSFENRVLGGVLPLPLFCGGHNYFVSKMAQRHGWDPYSIHTTYQYAAAAGKRHRLREAMVWEDPVEYYDPPGGLLVFEPDVPQRLVYPPGGMHALHHIALIDHQLAQIRQGLLLANALGRKLVLPSVTCGYDKYWGPLHHGVIPGTHTWALPIRDCPVDHYLEVHQLDPVNSVREFSFLRNPRTPEAVRRSLTSTALRPAGGAAELSRLRALRNFKVLNVSNLLENELLTSGVLNSDELAAASKRFKNVGGGWCCATAEDTKAGRPRRNSFKLWSAKLAPHAAA